VAPLGVVVRGFDIQAHIPSVASPADGGEQDSGARRDDYLTRARIEAFGRTEQSSQPPGVVVHADRPDLRHGDRPRMTFPDADQVTAISVLLVAQTEAVATASLAPVSGKTHPPVPALGVCRERPPEVDGGFLEHLRGDLMPPGKPGHLLGGCAIRRDYETRPALSLIFQALKALIRSNPDHGTVTGRPACAVASASVTSRRLWL
jgi:hypothetical protein